MTKEPVFEVGQKVVATGNYGYSVTEEKVYTVVGYHPEVVTPTFTWPAYVTVLDDFGREVTGHTYRFRPVEVQS